jgi:hypothetical protein
MARKVHKSVVMEAVNNCSGCRGFRDEACYLGIELLDDLDFATHRW